MSVKNLIICDNECSYANALMENILEKEELSVRVHACTSWEMALSLLQKQGADLLLIDEEWAPFVEQEAKESRVFCLTGSRFDKEEKPGSIYKYQCADMIVAELFEDAHVFHTVRGEKQQFLAVYSPIHRAGRTSFALALGRELAGKRKVLYLNLEEYPDRSFGSAGSDLSDLLYYLKQESDNIGLRLDAMVQQDRNLFYLPPIPLASDLKEVTAKEWMELLEKLSESRYETVILDLGESVQGLQEILGFCDRIYMPVLTDEISEKKRLRYEENIRRQNWFHLEEKTRKIVMDEDAEIVAARIAGEEF